MTFDRYLLRHYLYVFSVCFVATFGLVVVIDLFENLDEFLDRSGTGGTLAVLESILKCYAVQSIFFLDRAGPTMIVVSVMVVLIVLQRTGELHPLLAAGIPMYRVLAPLICASAVLSLILVANQEFVVPNIAHVAYEKRGDGESTKHAVEAMIDHSSRILIGGESVRLGEKTIEDAFFVLPSPSLVTEITSLNAPTARFVTAKGNRPAGWFLKDISLESEQLDRVLTERGRELIWTKAGSRNVFLVSSVTCDQLFKRESSFSMLSISDLVQRIKSPAVGTASLNRIILHLHQRLTQPLLNLLAVLITIPLMVRRESPGLAADSALCGFVLAVLFGATQASQVLATNEFVAADAAAWIPVMFAGTVSAWLSGVIRT